MKTQAAILWGQDQDWSVEEIELDPPKAGEVLLELVGSGLCHSDEHLLTGDMVMEAATAAELGIEQFPSSAAMRARARYSKSARA